MSRCRHVLTFLRAILFVTPLYVQVSFALVESIPDNSSIFADSNSTRGKLAHSNEAEGAKNLTKVLPRRVGTTVKPIMSCYFTGWDQWKQSPYKFLPSSVDPFLCTHIIYAFSKISHNWRMDIYEHNAHEQYRELVGLKRINPDLKILLAIGGWTHGGRSFSQMTADSSKRKIFIDDVVQQILQFELDGFDLDWEYPGSLERGSKPEDKENYVIFLKELRYALDSSGKKLLLSAAVAAGKANIENGYNIPEVNKYVDYLNLLSYDFHGAWDPITGINAPFSSNESTLSMSWAADYWVAHGADPNKIVIGLATYGRAFTLKNQQPYNHSVGAPIKGPGKAGQFTLEPGVLAYYEICKHLKVDGWESKWDPAASAPYAYKGDQWVGYENKRSLDVKLDYVKDNCFAGVMVWDLALDDHTGINCNQGKYPLINSIKSSINGEQWSVKCPRKSITGSTTPQPTTLSVISTVSVSSVVTESPSLIPSSSQTTASIVTQATTTVEEQETVTGISKPIVISSSQAPSTTEISTLEVRTSTEPSSEGKGISATLGPTLPTIAANDTKPDQYCELGRKSIYECQAEGSFMDKYSCGQYYECVKNGITGEYLQYHRSCADPHQTYFSDQTTNCVWRKDLPNFKELCPCDHEIDSIAISVVTQEPDEYTSADSKPTPPLPFISSSECKAATANKFSCKASGLFSDNTDCRFYWECVYNAHANLYYEYRRSCPPGDKVVFDQNIQTCVWSWQSSTYDASHCPCNVATKGLTSSTLSPSSGSIIPDISSEATVGSPKEKVLFCYFTGWDQWKTNPYKFTPASVDPFLCTHIIYAFLNLGVNFTIQNIEHNTEEQFQELKDLKKQNPNLKILAGLGGWNAGAKQFSELAKSPHNIKVFIEQATEYLLNRSLDGLDLDWEYPGHAEQGGSSEDKANLPILLKELRNHLDSEAIKHNVPKLLLTAAVSAGELNIVNGYDIPKITKYMDYVLVMTYDMNGHWQPHAGFNSPLFDPKSDFSMSWALNYWHKEGVPLHKLVAGIPAYGRSFKLRHPQMNKPGDPILGAGPHGKYTGEEGTLSKYEICLMVKNSSLGWGTTFDTHSKVPYSFKNNLWVTYENSESIRAKAQHVLKQNYAGAMVWDFALDDFTGLACNEGKYPIISLLSSLLGISDTNRNLSMKHSSDNKSIENTDSSGTQFASKPLNESSGIKDSTDNTIHASPERILSNRIEQTPVAHSDQGIVHPPYSLKKFLADVLEVMAHLVEVKIKWPRTESKRAAVYETDPHSFGNKMADITNLNLLSYLKDNLSIPEEVLFNYTSQLADPMYSPYWLNLLRIIKAELTKNITAPRFSDRFDNLPNSGLTSESNNQDDRGMVFYNFDETNENRLDGGESGKVIGAPKILRLNGTSTYFDNETVINVPADTDLSLTRKLNINMANISIDADKSARTQPVINVENFTAGLRVRLILPTDLNRQLMESNDILSIIRNLTITRHVENVSAEGSARSALRPAVTTQNGSSNPIILSLVIKKEDGSGGQEDLTSALLHLSRNVYVGDETKFNHTPSSDGSDSSSYNIRPILIKPGTNVNEIVDLKSILATGKRVDDYEGTNQQIGSLPPDEIYVNINNYSLILNLSSILKGFDRDVATDKSKDPILWDAAVSLGKLTDDSYYSDKNIIRIRDYRFPSQDNQDFRPNTTESPEDLVQALQEFSIETDSKENNGTSRSITLKIDTNKFVRKNVSKRALNYPIKFNGILKNEFMRQYINDRNFVNTTSAGADLREKSLINPKTNSINKLHQNGDDVKVVKLCNGPAVDFKCVESGFFLDKYDCRYYWQCTNGLKDSQLLHEDIHALCPNGKVFDEKVVKCVEPWFIPNITTICKCSKSLTYLRHAP